MHCAARAASRASCSPSIRSSKTCDGPRAFGQPYRLHPISRLPTMSTAYHQLVEFICTSNVPFRLLGHPPCRTSQESAAARAAAGVPGSAGAKALIIKSAEPTGFMMAVLPGTARLCNDRVRELVGKFHFANPLEIAEVAGGLSPGMIP